MKAIGTAPTVREMSMDKAEIEREQQEIRALGHELHRLRADPYIEDGNKTIWVDCPIDGRVPPRTAMHPGGYRYALQSAPRYVDGVARWVYCSVCGEALPARAIKLKASVSQDVKCGLRCLNAKANDCNCPACLGKCHGRGECSCQEER